ncbi:frequency clock protein [Astrocystis sublimbata]|nr:frequency clock protein [Astrocystis sublimbata]
MADPQQTQVGANLSSTPVTYNNPRRTTPENSITLRHHRLARDASKRHSPPSIPTIAPSTFDVQARPLRKNSSDESHQTVGSDPMSWFDKSNQHTGGTLLTSAMDVDPPFYQKETDSSNEEANIPSSHNPSYRHSFRPSMAKSSSADDYRSVIDDLTIENKRLKEELRKLRQMGPNSMRNDKLFEVKMHGLPASRKRELEATLRDFTTKLERSDAGASTSRKKSANASKHTSSTSGSNSRPVDSAYASMGTGQSSSGPGQSGPQNKISRLRTNQNVQDYLRDIPEGLWPKPTTMTDHEKKKLVVKRLEHLFTGQMGHPSDQRFLANDIARPTVEDNEMRDAVAVTAPAPAPAPAPEGIREAVIRSGDRRHQPSHSHTTTSASNTRTQSQPTSNSHSHSHSYADQSVDPSSYRDNDKDSGSGSGSGGRSKNPSPQEDLQHSEQRPTRPRDLDPDRKQVPADNMDYIRHLGIVAPESQLQYSAKDVSPDAEGWVYLNLLGNLAQLHILNVTPDFIRSAVSEKSTKFQLSHDGRKIRWRGGDEGTRFTSDSGSKSQTERSSDDTDGSNEHNQRKKQKGSKFNLGVQDSNSSANFHYKPLFKHHQSTSSEESEQSGMGESSSCGPSEESKSRLHSRWAQSGVSTGPSQRKRRRDGAVIYYSGAPFCTDLSGDYNCGEVSPTTYDMTSSDQPMQDDSASLQLAHRPFINRSASGSSLPFKPLSEPSSASSLAQHSNSSSGVEPLPSDDGDCIDADFSWSNAEQKAFLVNFEASGLGGVTPDDHFVIVISTKRPKEGSPDKSDNDSDTDNEDAELESPPRKRRRAIQIDYVNGKIRRLPPVPLPPPTFYFPSGESYSDYGTSFEGEASVSSERSILSKRPMIENSPDSDNRDLSGNDEEDEHSDAEPSLNMYSGAVTESSNSRRRNPTSIPLLAKNNTGSSVATAGGMGSGYYSSMEDA